jgi:hypothetical protein
MNDDEEVDYKQELVQRSKSKERFGKPVSERNGQVQGVFEGYLVKVIDTSNFIRGLKHKRYYVLDMEIGVLY